MKQKTLRGDRTAAERKMPLTRPAAGGESRVARFFIDFSIANPTEKIHTLTQRKNNARIEEQT
ncbi:MAG: hypothetical protein Q4C48_09965 [Lachnospiraceae bacterium]|nr:hypothetical protein [Lachnospiraceae bacterium]